MSSKTYDEQDDYCEACRAHRAPDTTHDQAVPSQCGRVDLQGFDVVLECARQTGHNDSHRNIQGTSWPSGLEDQRDGIPA